MGNMHALHLIMLTAATAALAAVAASTPLLNRRGNAGSQLRQLGYVVTLALVVGNAASLLPATPLWYSIALVVATVAGLVWLLVSLLALVREPRPRPARTPVVIASEVVAPPMAPRRRLGPLSLEGMKLVTAGMIHDAGPEESRKAASSTVYVAANIGTYAPNRARRRHLAVAGSGSRQADPTTAVRRERVLRAYANGPEPTPRVRSTL